MSTSVLNQPIPDLTDWNLAVEGMTCASCVPRVERALRAVPRGMTCASCAARIEKALRKVPGVVAALAQLNQRVLAMESMLQMLEYVVKCCEGIHRPDCPM